MPDQKSSTIASIRSVSSETKYLGIELGHLRRGYQLGSFVHLYVRTAPFYR
jgi:hypothetical protein